MLNLRLLQETIRENKRLWPDLHCAAYRRDAGV